MTVLCVWCLYLMIPILCDLMTTSSFSSSMRTRTIQQQQQQQQKQDDDDDEEEKEEEEGNVLLSTASLQNNIGVLLLLLGSIDEATERFHLAIESSVITSSSSSLSQEEEDKNNPAVVSRPQYQTPLLLFPKQQRVRQRHQSAMSYDGLVWFYQRLCRQVLGNHHCTSPIPIPTPPPPTATTTLLSQPSSSSVSTTTTTRSTKRISFSSLNQQQHYYNTTYHPPLGLEYILEPIMVGPKTKDGQIAAYLNVAYIHLTTFQQQQQQPMTGEQVESKYNKNKNHYQNHYQRTIQQTCLDLLQQAKVLLISTTKQMEEKYNNNNNKQKKKMDEEEDKEYYISLSLTIITHVNIGVLLFSLGHVKDSFLEFQQAMDCHSLLLYHPSLSLVTSSNNNNAKTVQQQQQEHLGTQIYEYLHCTILCNLICTYIRMNQIHRAMELCHQLITEPHVTNTTTISSSSTYTLFPFFPTSSITRLPQKCKWMIQHLTKYYFQGLIQHRQEHCTVALESMNHFLSSSRIEYGHSHIYIAVILERKGAILFDQRNLHGAMLAYLASLRIYESWTPTLPRRMMQQKEKQDYHHEEEIFQVERARLLYAIGRTLHDREEYIDALSIYNKALEVQRDIVVQNNQTSQQQPQQEYHHHHKKKNACVDVITTLCNVGRIHHLLGDLDKAIRVNQEVVTLAIEMVTREHLSPAKNNPTDNADESLTLSSTTTPSTTSPPTPPPESHDFVRNRMISLGNLYVEAGRLEEAMTLFTRIARSQGLESMLSYRPEGSDIDTSAFAVKAAERLGKIGFQIPHAAAA